MSSLFARISVYRGMNLMMSNNKKKLTISPDAMIAGAHVPGGKASLKSRLLERTRRHLEATEFFGTRMTSLTVPDGFIAMHTIVRRSKVEC